MWGLDDIKPGALIRTYDVYVHDERMNCLSNKCERPSHENPKSNAKVFRSREQGFSLFESIM